MGLEDLMKVTKTEMNNTSTKNLHKLEILEDKISNIEDEQGKVKNQIQEVSKTIKDHALSVDKVCSDMKTGLDNSVAETNKKLNVFIDDISKSVISNSTHLEDHEEKLNKVLALTGDQSEISSAIASRIQSVETKLSSYDEKNKTLTENILVTSETQLKDFRNKFDSRIAELVKRTDQHSDQFDQAELNMVDLIKKIDEKQHHVDRGFEEVKRNAAQEKDLLIIQFKEQNDKFESVFNSIDEKVEIMETKLISQVDHRVDSVQKELRDLGFELHDYINRNKEDLQSIRRHADSEQQNLWTTLLHLSSVFRGYTVVLKSEGIVKKYQADVLGVYRMVDSYNDRPVYKQDGGENYIYYSSTSETWFVGTVVGHQYGWLRNSTEDSKNKRWIPDLKSGWEYRPLVRSTDNLQKNTWHSDDGSLRIEYLRDVEKINELFRDVKVEIE